MTAHTKIINHRPSKEKTIQVDAELSNSIVTEVHIEMKNEE